ncbi:MAG: hypothetical protein ACQEV6_11020 [Pseudomonadota bacterium]
MMLDSPKIQSAVRKTVAAVLGFMLALVLLTALLITGFYFLVNAATLALTPILGEAAAMTVTGLGCLLILALFFHRLVRTPSKAKSDDSGATGSGSPIESLRNLIKQNPLESALAAFALGVAEQNDPRLKSLLLQGGMVLMKESERAQEAPPSETAGDDAS